MGVGGRIVTVGLRSITWPLTGLLTDRVVVSMVVALAVIVLIGIAVLPRREARAWSPGTERWLAAGLGVSIVLLAVFAASLAVIIPELPNDHYHAFLDPVVLSLVAAGLVRVAGAAPRGAATGDAVSTGDSASAGASARGGGATLSARRVAVALATAALVLVGVTAWPPATAPDGGWPVADDAAARVHAETGSTTIVLQGVPLFKNDNALRFPLERRGAPVLPVPGPANASIGGLSVVVGLFTLLIASINDSFSYGGGGGDDGETVGAVMVLGGLGMVGGGIPLLVYGSKRVMVSENALVVPPVPQGEVVIGPGSFGFRGTF